MIASRQISVISPRSYFHFISFKYMMLWLLIIMRTQNNIENLFQCWCNIFKLRGSNFMIFKIQFDANFSTFQSLKGKKFNLFYSLDWTFTAILFLHIAFKWFTLEMKKFCDVEWFPFTIQSSNFRQEKLIIWIYGWMTLDSFLMVHKTQQHKLIFIFLIKVHFQKLNWRKKVFLSYFQFILLVCK